MPYFFDEEGIEWADENTEPPPPRAEQFIYMPVSDYTGKKDPVRFTVPAYDPSFGRAQQDARKLSFLDRLFGRNAQSASRPAYSDALHKKRWQQIVALMVPALRDLGVKQLYCRYDGGNDEGFAWFDHAIMQSGETIPADALAKRLSETDLPGKVSDADLVERRGLFAGHVQMTEMLNDWLASEWASQLLGGSYGAGQYSMYGAFTVDLDQCTIEDDPDAEPIVQNITIAG